LSAAGNLHIIGYDLEKAPHLMYGMLDSEGRLVKHFPLPVEYRSMYHDFAITQHYTVIAQMPLVFDPKVGGCQGCGMGVLCYLSIYCSGH
jgi:carotenoid cleavage dioxygenase